MIEVVQYTPGFTLPDGPCFVAGMPNEVYHAWPEGISSSGLRSMERSPAHYRYQAKREPSRAMEIGTAIHAALLEPDRFRDEYVLLRDVDDRRSAAYKAAEKVHGSERVLTASEATRVACMAGTVLANPVMHSRFTAPGWRELSLFVRDPVTGVLVRVRYDLMTCGALAVDLKSAHDCSPEAFSRSCATYGYDVQAALYADAYEWATGTQLSGFEFAVVESEMPHAHKLYTPDVIMMQNGRARYRRALSLYAECARRADWPLPSCEGPELVTLPAWAVSDGDIVEDIV